MSPTRLELTGELADEFAAFVVAPPDDPYSLYDRLREVGPLVWSNAGFWFSTSHALASETLRDDETWSRDSRTSNSAEVVSGRDDDTSFSRRIVTSVLLWVDDPAHARLRRLVNRAFTPRMINNMRGRIEDTVQDVLAAALSSGPRIDLLRDVASPLPTTVIMRLLGLDPLDSTFGMDEFLQLAEIFVGVVEPSVTEERMAEADAIFKAAADHILQTAEQRRRQPADDLLTALALAQEEGDRLSDDELVGMVAFLVAAGHDTTSNLLATATYRLLLEPSQLELLRSDPALAVGATEEVLRFDTSARNAMSRWAHRDVEVAGQRIERGDKLVVCLAAANRDPAEFADPHRFDIRRDPNRHLSFGAGAHFCLGSGLARIETQAALRAVSSIPGLRLDGDVHWKPSFVIRGVQSLPIAHDSCSP